MPETVLQLLSLQLEKSPTEPRESDGLRKGVSDLKVGDVVRSKERYWLKTGQYLCGAIVRFENVPESQVQAAGCNCWAYLNSGEGPISVEILEKAPSDYSQLKSLHTALENFQQQLEPAKPVSDANDGSYRTEQCVGGNQHSR